MIYIERRTDDRVTRSGREEGERRKAPENTPGIQGTANPESSEIRPELRAGTPVGAGMYSRPLNVGPVKTMGPISFRPRPGRTNADRITSPRRDVKRPPRRPRSTRKLTIKRPLARPRRAWTSVRRVIGTYKVVASRTDRVR